MDRAVVGLRTALQGLEANQNAALHGAGSVLNTFIDMKETAAQLDGARRRFKFRKGALTDRLFNVSKIIGGHCEEVLLGNRTVEAFRANIPELLQRITILRNVGMRF